MDPAQDGMDLGDDGQNLCLCSSTIDTGVALISAGLFPKCLYYVAVSYCWEKATDTHTGAADFLRSSNCPPHILRRAIRYASSKGCGLIWIDQECIHQQDRDDKENGIQSMDGVFANSLFPVGILRTRIDTQEHLDAMAMLVSEQMQQFGEFLMSSGLAQAPWDVSPAPLLQGIPWTAKQQLQMLEVLLIILSDSWFTRSWITQELICSNDMVLLLEIDVSLTRPEDLNLGPHEDVQISVKQLLNSIWWSMMPHNLALLREMPEERNDILLVFWKLFPFTRPIPKGQSRNICTFLSAWNLIQTTHNSRIADRLAIMGNFCHYPARINSAEAEARGLNFSTCMITQALLNGDLGVLLPQPLLVDFRGAVASRESRFFPGKGSWLQSLVHYPIERPGGFGAGYDSRWPPAYFRVCRLSELGLVCQGHLWKLEKEIDLGGLQRSIHLRNSVYRLSTFFVNLPHHVVCSILRLIRQLAACIGIPGLFGGSRWLLHPDLIDTAGREKRIERTKCVHFLRDFRDEFRYAHFLRLRGKGQVHPLSQLEIRVEEKLGQSLLDLVDLQRLCWLLDRVEEHGRIWGASYVRSDGTCSDQVSAIFDCGDPEDEEIRAKNEKGLNDGEESDSDEDSNNGGNQSKEIRERPPIYVFTLHSDGLVQHPGHSVQFRATSWVVEIVDGRLLRCKDLIYGFYDYGQAEPSEYTLSWD
ncbi:heterokaryon incompatibility protein-domain-containing protein [Tricladium varicosporioides]|nr:heterokaryon incompatibility protein-domain-containing protein [Hymenoscyphus varicosporioides]